MGYAYCVPLVDLWSGDDGKWLIERLNEPQHPHYVSDDLRHHKNAPVAVQEYNGPFEIKVSEIGIEQAEMQTDDSDPYTPCPRCNARDGFTWTESVAVWGDVHTAGSGRPMPETERQTNVHSKGKPACNNCGDEIALGEFSD
jgi:hypothetical protein